MEGIKIKSVVRPPTVKFWELKESNYKLHSSVKAPKAKVYVKETQLTLNGLSEHILEVYKKSGKSIQSVKVEKYEINKGKVSNPTNEVKKNIKKLIEKHHPDIDELIGKFKTT